MSQDGSGYGFPSKGRQIIEPPRREVVKVISVLIENENPQLDSSGSDEKRTLLHILVNQFRIPLEGFLSQLHQLTVGARSDSSGGDASCDPGVQEPRMKERREDRLRAELEVLQEIQRASEQAPCSAEELDRLIQKRRAEFDKAWDIDPETKDNPFPLRVVK